MAWDDLKNPGDSLTASEWNAMTANQKSRVLKSLFDANTILKADSDNVPTALAIAASRLIGRKATGSIAALTNIDAKTLLAIAIADLTDGSDIIKRDGSVSMAGILLPDGDLSRNLGSATYRWANVYMSSLICHGQLYGGFTIYQDLLPYTTEAYSLGSAAYKWDLLHARTATFYTSLTTNLIARQAAGDYINFGSGIEFNGASGQHIKHIHDLLPKSSGASDIGTNALQFHNIYGYDIYGSVRYAGGGKCDQHWIPEDDNTYNLGSAFKYWKDIYVKGTINFTNAVPDTNGIKTKPVDAPVAGDDGKFLEYDHAASKFKYGAGGGDGEVNTASNVGTVGTGIFKQKTGVDLELYKLNSVNNRLTIALNGTDRMDFTVVETNIDHDALTNFIAAEHLSLPNTIANVLSDHNKVAHDALAINAGQVDGIEGADIFKKDGTITMTGDLNMGNHGINSAQTILPNINDYWYLGGTSNKWRRLYAMESYLYTKLKTEAIEAMTSNIVVNSPLIPNTDLARNFGSAAKRWANTYVNALICSASLSGGFTISQDLLPTTTETYLLGSAAKKWDIVWARTTDFDSVCTDLINRMSAGDYINFTDGIEFNGAAGQSIKHIHDLLPKSSGNGDVGTNALKFANMYAHDVYAGIRYGGGGKCDQHWQPEDNNTYRLGTAFKYWSDIYATNTHFTNAPIPASHAADKHTDRTRKIWVPVSYATDGMSLFGSYAMGQMTDGNTRNCAGTITVPADFVSSGVMKCHVTPISTGNLRYEVRAMYAANGQSYATHTNVGGAQTQALSNGIMFELPSLSLASLAAGDVIGLRIERDGGNALDTMGTSVYCPGFLFEYTADM